MRRAGFFFLCAASFGVLACTAVLGDFEVASSAGDASANGADVVTNEDAGGGGGGSDAGTDSAPPGCPPGQELVNGSCVLRCKMGGTECGAHGKCTNSATGTACVCDKEYAGPTCGSCAQGYQDKNGDDTCLPDCAKANLTCPLRSACRDVSGTAECACAAGYTLDTGVCAWTGVIRDPAFAGSPAGAWTLQPMGTTGISFAPTGSAAGMKDTGYAVISGDSMCNSNNGRPEVVQDFDMPSVAQSEPMSLTIWSAATFPNGPGIGAFGRIGPAMGNGPTGSFYWSIDQSDTYGAQKYCLGELAYGPNRRVAMSMYANGCNGANASIKGYIDRASIAPDATCPAVGKIFNGDFEAGPSGWTSGAFGGTGDVLANVGTGGTYGAKLTSFQDCDSAYLTGTISVPLPATLAQPALKFSFKGPGNGQVSRIRYDGPYGGGVIAGNMQGNVNGTFGSLVACLPEHAKGQVGTIQLEMPQSTTCGLAQADSRQFFYDDLQIVSEPSCPAQAFILDGDFEKGGPTSPWVFNNNVSSMTTGGVKVAGTNHYGSISATRACNEAITSLAFSVPQFNMGQFYKIDFQYRTTETGGGGTFTVSTNGPETTLASTNGNWMSKTSCLTYGGNGSTITFHAKPTPGGASCGDILTQQTLDIDSVVGTVVATCP